MPTPLRTVVFEHGVYNQLSDLVPDPVLLDHLIKGVEFLTARDPMWGQPIDNRTRRVTVYIPPTGRNVFLYYVFDDQKVNFRRLREGPFDHQRLRM